MIENMKIAMVVSQFNQEITDKLAHGAMIRLLQNGVTRENINLVKVPGAIEIPLAAQLLAKLDKYHAIIALGAVIRGETDHYDYVCQQVSHGCQQVMLAFEVPVIFGVLTTDTMEQAHDRCGGKEGHKGYEAAEAALAMATLEIY